MKTTDKATLFDKLAIIFAAVLVVLFIIAIMRSSGYSIEQTIQRLAEYYRIRG